MGVRGLHYGFKKKKPGRSGIFDGINDRYYFLVVAVFRDFIYNDFAQRHKRKFTGKQRHQIYKASDSACFH